MAMDKARIALFGPNAKEIKAEVRKRSREIDREIRGIKRDLTKNEREQQKIKAKMQKDAKEGNHVSQILQLLD